MLLFQRCRTWSMSRTILLRVQRTFKPIVKSVQHEEQLASGIGSFGSEGMLPREIRQRMVSSECSIVVEGHQRRGQCSRVGLVD